MEICILQGVEGARAATGLTVIIDVFRAFSVEAYLFAMGATRIFPIGDEAVAYRLKAEDPTVILAGERHGKILPDFDTGNAPSELAALPVAGRQVVHTTSAGTQGIANAVNATEILGASLVNARATAEYIRRRDPETVSLVCMGWMGTEETEEDTLCARYIRALLTGEVLDMPAEIEHLKITSGAKFFDPAQQDVFPEADFAMCTDLDRFDFAMRLHADPDGVNYMEMCR